ncbi:hypothetical protein N9M66_04465 [Litoreibacter sp.]|nr:hypothetical protein [Litoreibacter sp.]MDA8747445.1 hypothetical protein [Litoreibacter sp.]
MALTYTELTTLVRNWCNRDEEVVSDAIIKDCLRYAADKAYRTLRVPPLENVAVYEKSLLESATAQNQLGLTTTELQLPFDLIEFIQIKELDSDNKTIRVFNEKLDIRTFNDVNAEKYSNMNYWARQRNLVFLSPGFNNRGQANSIELLYYRRLPALNALYAVTVLNYNAGFLTTSGAGAGIENSALLYFNSNTSTTAYATSADAQAADPAGTVTSAYYIGTLVPNWLRDQNERVLLFGALAEIFAFTQEDDQAQKYGQMFYSEIKELNDEDGKRNASGGNVQINFNGRGLI